jgi:Ni,Fe-hydrogenase I large subunit
MIVKKLIEKIEGEAELDFSFSNGKIDDVRIHFGFYRGVEEILVGKDARDALVITPRVCGICNHAHLISAVRAIEDGYRAAGMRVELSDKAKSIRDFTLSCELIQNHTKWFYMTILPQLEKLVGESTRENYLLKASHFSSTITKALAIFAGQWPHSSYAVPGGVTCDPSYVDIVQAESLIDESIRFFEQVMVDSSLDKYLSIDSVPSLFRIGGDIGKMISLLSHYDMDYLGQSHDRFIVFGDGLLSASGKALPTTVSTVDLRFVEELIQEGTTAKAVQYRGRLYEVGPLARAMVSKEPIVKSLHKRYKDSILTRIFARVHEVATLLRENKKLLQNLSLQEPSCTIDREVKVTDFDGTGVVEAARGSLIHKTSVREGVIDKYEIIVPTQWNLSHGDEESHGIAIEAMVGSQSISEASFIFRTFDICSVCSTK